MQYMFRNSEPRRHPSSILADVRSVIMVGWSYADRSSDSAVASGPVNLESIEETGHSQRTVPDHRTGKAARYARGDDYHEVLWRKLDLLLKWLALESPGCRGRSVVDSAPLLERDFARRAGLGWFGKNTMLISKQHGSLFFLGALLVDLELQPDPPHVRRATAGPAPPAWRPARRKRSPCPGWLDARRCISYLTIDILTSIPEELRPGMGDWLFGCDICQDVCPWNSKKNAEAIALDPIELLGLSNEQFRIRFRNSAIWRTKRRGLLRNAALVLGNIGDQSALPALTKALDDAELLIRDAASWAISKIVERRQPGKGGG